MYKRYCFFICPLAQELGIKYKSWPPRKESHQGLAISEQHESLEEVFISTAIKSSGFRKLDLSASMKTAL